MKVIALIGYPGVGKTTGADIIVKYVRQLVHKNDRRMMKAGRFSLARHLKNSIGYLLRNRDLDLDNQAVKNNLVPAIAQNEEGTRTYRQLLQLYGTEMVLNNINKDFWAKDLVGVLKSNKKKFDIAVIDDLRYVNELNVLSDFDPDIVIIEVTRDGFVAHNHISDYEFHNIKSDFIIKNDSLSNYSAQLKGVIDHLIEQKRI